MSKTFTFAGTCVENGAVVYKFANDANRAKALERFGCTEINIIALPNAMDKEAAVAYLAQVGMTATKPARAPKAATKPVKAATVKVKVKDAKKATTMVAGNDAALKEQWAEAMAEREANGLMPTVSFAEWKRNSAKWDKFMAKVDAKLEAKRAAGQICF